MSSQYRSSTVLLVEQVFSCVVPCASNNVLVVQHESVSCPSPSYTIGPFFVLLCNTTLLSFTEFMSNPTSPPAGTASEGKEWEELQEVFPITYYLYRKQT